MIQALYQALQISVSLGKCIHIQYIYIYIYIYQGNKLSNERLSHMENITLSHINIDELLHEAVRVA